VRSRLLGVELSTGDLERIETYCRLLANYNEHTNLVSKADPKTLINDHLLDSIALLPLIRRATADKPFNNQVIDIGSGAGFPGIIIAMLAPELAVKLVDSIGKKTRFLTQTAAELDLARQVSVVTGRAEELGHDRTFREAFAVATARAVGSLQLIAELCLPLLSVGGFLLAQKSVKQAALELEEAQAAISLLGGSVSKVADLDANVLGREHCVILIEKTKPTPREYPRSAARMKKEPLI
jgi:16S rRNA (guanine527-N7)-methyltransferase